ncbi:hypothetical protein GYMLUDRAFT_251703 [Collybiopsis luxurians FD-317 M1]|uniref:Uncharacterized protein n=1 Tax=Collybiopsis luxurians FD-317 M1 TaxID=944289 RepID=A0A0D0BBV6_9AGAR|nr:hypothetical protein GYMLUDRAFT_251703 [Collybiopsis luxurians FD-317 M1]
MAANQLTPHLAKRDPPPPPLTVLLAHRDLPKVQLHPVLTHTDLREVVSPSRLSRKTECMHPYTRPSHRRQPSIALSLSSDSSSEDEQPGTSVSRISQIKKPKNASHLTLDELRGEMGWNQENFENCKSRLVELAEYHLLPKAHKYQDEKKMELVKQMILKDYPPLNNFHELWPIDILLMGILKRQREKEKAGSKSCRSDAPK